MKRKPKVGDTVCIVSFKHGHYRDIEPYEAVVSNVGTKYFYADEKAFEIDSFVDGSWSDKYSVCGNTHSFSAYLSREVYDKQMLKERRIDEIKSAELLDLSCDQIAHIHKEVFNSSYQLKIEEWERNK